MTDEDKDRDQGPSHQSRTGGAILLPTEADRAKTAQDAEKEDERKYKQTQTSIQSGILWTQILLVTFGIIGSGISLWQADVAQRAANTARDALHISERAYITVGTPVLIPDQKAVQFTLLNQGHIPSGPVRAVIYELNERADGTVVEGHWSIIPFPELAPYTDSTSRVINIGLHDIDLDTINGAHGGDAGIDVAGTVSYNDGFPDTPQQQASFCFHSLFVKQVNVLQWAPCDAAYAIPGIKQRIGYPQRYEQGPQH